jgi:hypothetical protein
MNGKNDRLNGQRLATYQKEFKSLSTPMVPAWTSNVDNKFNDNYVYLPLAPNPISNSIGVTPTIETVNSPTGLPITTYHVPIVNSTGGWGKEFIETTNSIRASQIALHLSRMDIVKYT